RHRERPEALDRVAPHAIQQFPSADVARDPGLLVASEALHREVQRLDNKMVRTFREPRVAPAELSNERLKVLSLAHRYNVFVLSKALVKVSFFEVVEQTVDRKFRRSMG